MNVSAGKQRFDGPERIGPLIEEATPRLGRLGSAQARRDTSATLSEAASGAMDWPPFLPQQHVNQVLSLHAARAREPHAHCDCPRPPHALVDAASFPSTVRPDCRHSCDPCPLLVCALQKFNWQIRWQMG